MDSFLFVIFRTVPKTAVLAVVKQMERMAVDPLEKGVAFYHKSTEETDLTIKVSAAKKSISKLVDLVDTHPQAQLYLAMAYVQLYAGQQELLKKKTEVGRCNNFDTFFSFETGIDFYFNRKKWSRWVP